MRYYFLSLAAVCLIVAGCEASSGTSSADTSTQADTASGGDTGSAADGSAGTDTATATDTSSGGQDTATAEDTATAQDTATAAGGWAEVAPIFAAKCSTCHPAPAKFYDAKVCSQVAASKSKGQISVGLMPPKGSPALTADEKSKILAWFAAGAKCP